MPRVDGADNNETHFKILPMLDSLLPKHPRAIATSIMYRYANGNLQKRFIYKAILRKKSNKWGCKLIVLCDTRGRIVHNLKNYRKESAICRTSRL